MWVEPGTTPAVYTVGAPTTAGSLPLGGEGWVRVPVGATGDLWWVTGVRRVFAADRRPRGPLRPFDRGVTDLSVPAALENGWNATLYGVWGASKDDLWSVGQSATGGAAIFRRDATSWSVPELPAEAAGQILYKGWGTAADDVWICGSGGLLLHFDGNALALVESHTPEALFTLHGTSQQITSQQIAVGGTIQPAIVERDALGWHPATYPSARNPCAASSSPNAVTRSPAASTERSCNEARGSGAR